MHGMLSIHINETTTIQIMIEANERSNILSLELKNELMQTHGLKMILFAKVSSRKEDC